MGNTGMNISNIHRLLSNNDASTLVKNITYCFYLKLINTGKRGMRYRSGQLHQTCTRAAPNDGIRRLSSDTYYMQELL
jgi:hypothetical protein